MKVGGTLLIGVGIIIMVLVANGRWDNVWASALGTNLTNGSSGSVSPISSATSNVVNGQTANGQSISNTASATYAGTQSGPRRG